MISISDLTFQYPSGKSVFKNLSLQLKAGKIYGLLGKNGAGKTTLIKNILGLRRPQQGTINTFDHNPGKRELSLLQQYFFIPEDPFIPEVSMKEYIDRYAPFYPNFKIEKFLQLLKEFDLERNIHLKNLSFGQKKKALIAFAIATYTPLLIMDEPTNGLDIPSKKQFRKIISHIADEGRLFIISTHQIRDLHSLIDHVLLIDEGHVVVNHDMLHISDALSFDVHRNELDDSMVIYQERVPGGYLAITEGGNDDYLEVDLEVLFNAIITKKEQITHLLKSNTYA
ncbi:MAG: ABC transporter ATP-binding protein [Saprospiraceae bacterium]|nr:ABC transporter ATP-binding protein [Saprospiraceae bacterium]|tara:strand:+ start:2270 stop:3118 length:849 start_codon:yes stop_codon:yes gene_type:complete